MPIEVLRPRSSVALRVILPIVLALLLSIATVFTIAIPTMERNLVERKRETARELVATAWSHIDQLEQSVQAGRLTRDEAKRRAMDELRTFRYGPRRKDYFWVNDTQPVMVMHPYRPDLVGKDLSTFTDQQGTRPFVKFVDIVRKQGEGFVDYYWQWKDDPTRIEPKTSFVKLYEPWGWIIGTGVYMEDVRAEIADLTRKLGLTCLVIFLVAGALCAYAIGTALRTERARRTATEELATSEDKYRTLFQASGDAVFLTQDDRVIDCNQAALEMFGFSRREEFIGLGPLDVSPPVQPDGELSRDRARSLIETAFERGSLHFEWVHRRSDGSAFPADITLTVMELDGRRVMQAIIRDITETKRAEEKLARERERLFALLEALPAFVYLQAEDHTVRYANRAFIERFGEAGGRPCFQVLAGRDEPCVDCRTLEVLRTNQPISWEWQGPAGRTYQIYDYPFVDVEGTRLVLEMGIDITERKSAEEALRQSEAKLSSLFRAAPVGIGLVVDRVLKTVNERVCEMLGYSEDELIGRSARMLYETQEEFERVGRVKYGQIERYGTGTVETQWLCKDGRIIDIILSSSPLDPDAPSDGVTFTALNISARKEAERALRASEEQIRLITDSLPLLISYLGPDRRYRFANQAYERWFDLPVEQIVGKRPDDVLPPGSSAQFDPELEQALAGRATSTEGDLDHPCEGRRRLHLRYIPHTDQSGNVHGVIVVAEDITERREAEQKRIRLEEQLHQAQKMEAVGQLAAGVAHDFNNLLTAILGHTELAKGFESLNSEVVASLEMIEQAATQATGVTRSLLTFSRDLPIDRKPIDLRGVVEQAFRFLSRMIPASIEPLLEIEPDEEVWVNADGTQLQQVILNLAINARDAMPEGGRLVLRLTTVSREALSGSADLLEQADRYANLEVQDSGCGMSPEVQGRIFEPFYSTKPRGRGTGLGLSIVHGIIADHGGMVSVQSEVGGGSTFSVLLACLPSPQTIPERAATTGLPRGQGQVILLAEDDPYVRETASAMLRQIGYEVVPTADGDEALERYRADPQRIDLVLLDIDLPKRDGQACLQAIRRTDAEIPIVLTTGSGRTPPTNTDGNRIGFLYKPLHMTRLAQVLAEMLSATAEPDTT